MNRGHGADALGFWPSAKSNPVAEYWTVFNESAPRALEALPMTAVASCAAATAALATRVNSTNRYRDMIPPAVLQQMAAILTASRVSCRSFPTKEPARPPGGIGLSRACSRSVERRTLVLGSWALVLGPSVALGRVKSRCLRRSSSVSRSRVGTQGHYRWILPKDKTDQAPRTWSCGYEDLRGAEVRCGGRSCRRPSSAPIGSS